MTHPNDSEVVRVCAERDGYADIRWDWFDGHSTWKDWVHSKGHNLPSYIHSTDALRPLMAKLTGEERRVLVNYIAGTLWRDHLNTAGHTEDYTEFILMMDPSVLARAVAEAVLACRKEGGG